MAPASGGGSFVVRLRGDAAPITAARVLARLGDGQQAVRLAESVVAVRPGGAVAPATGVTLGDGLRVGRTGARSWLDTWHAKPPCCVRPVLHEGTPAADIRVDIGVSVTLW